MATPIPGADSDRLAALAQKYGLMISIGVDEKDGDKLYDSAILVDKTGKILWKHRKLNVLAWLMAPPYSEGRPEDIAKVAESYTGQFLAGLLKRRPAIPPQPSASGVENAQPMSPMKALALLSTLPPARRAICRASARLAQPA